MYRRSFTKGAVAFVASLSLAACFGLAGCSSNTEEAEPTEEPAAEEVVAEPEEAVELQIFAANSLEKALPEVQALYTEQTGVTFADTQFKSSGDLVAELEGGATADVLITASAGTMDKAVEDGFVAENGAATMFVNDLVLVAAADSDIAVSDLADLAGDGIGSIAIGEPNAVPAGKYAAQSLEAAGLCTINTDDDGVMTLEYADSIASKMNDGADKVGTVASYVSEGQCDVGLVYTSDLYRYEGIQSIFTVPADMHSAIVYPGATIEGSANAEAAADFLDFCLSNPDALQIWQKYGFELYSE